jgi:hypothetical protein
MAPSSIAIAADRLAWRALAPVDLSVNRNARGAYSGVSFGKSLVSAVTSEARRIGGVWSDQVGC